MDKNEDKVKSESGCDLASMERKFLKLYKKLSHLWNPNHPDYSNRYRRNAGYDALLPIYQQYMPEAKRFHIRQKINILRSCYRKELRKHLASRSIDSDGNVLYSYIPHSWKFQALRFLDCDEDGENEIDTSEIDVPDCELEEQESELVEPTETESGNDEPDTSKLHVSPIYIEEQKPFASKRSRDTTNNSFSSEEEVLEKELTAIGSNVACKLLRMSVQQRYRAELLINKVLIKGLKEHLTEETDLSNTWNDQLDASLNNSTSKDNSKKENIKTRNPIADQAYRNNSN